LLEIFSLACVTDIYIVRQITHSTAPYYYGGADTAMTVIVCVCVGVGGWVAV